MKPFLTILILTILTTISYAQDETQFIENYILQPENRTDEDKARFEEMSDINEKIKALPWGLPTSAYKLYKAGTIVLNMSALAQASTEASLEAATHISGLQTSNALFQGAFSGQLMAESASSLAQSAQDAWDMGHLFKDLNEVFHSKPGSSVELMAADYEAFIALFEQLELLKVLNKHNIDRPDLKNKIALESTVYLLEVSRQLAGLKKVTAGEVVAFSLEAEIAATLLEVPEKDRTQLLEVWDKNHLEAIKGRTSFIGKGRETLTNEVTSFLSEITTVIENPELAKGIRTSTYSAKTGILLLSLLQTKYRSADEALTKISQAETYLKRAGLESSYLATAVKPLSFTTSLIQAGTSKSAEWSIGSVSYIEYATGRGLTETAQFVSKYTPSLPSVGLPSFSIPSISMPSISNPFKSTAPSCSSLL